MSFAFAEPVTFLEAVPVTDPYSGDVTGADWSDPATVLVDAAGVEPIGSTEPVQDGRQAVVVGYRLYFDHILQVDRLWRALVRGDTLKVEGRPAVWRSPFTGWAAGTVVEVRWTDG